MKNIIEQGKKAIDILTSKGYEAYLVGGYVRDMLMETEPKDIDITTNALPTEVESAFFEYHIIETGLKHGTVTVMIESVPVEITTYRIDCGYSDGRHPDKVEFSDNIVADLARRDFTMNSIAYNPETGFVDPFGGKDDISRKIIRCVGDPVLRFTEDSLRILRAIRFSSVLGFKIDDETKRAMFLCKDLLRNVSNERVFSEITKTICGENIGEVLKEYIDIFSCVLPEIAKMKNFEQHNFHHIYDVLGHTAKVIENIEPIPYLRYSALFHDCGKPDCFSVNEKGVGHFYAHAHISAKKAEVALTRLRCDNSTKDKIVKLVKIHDTPIENTEQTVKKKLNRLGENMFFDLIKLQRADNMGLSPEYFYRQKEYDFLEDTAKKIIADNECFSLKDLSLNGNDLIKLGYKGKVIGEKLDFLLNSVIEKKVKNNKAELIQYLRETENK